MLDVGKSLPYNPPMTIIAYIQAVLAILLLVTILIQHRAAGLSATFGGNDSAYVQRRGAELFLYRFTIIISIVFFVLTIADWYI
jgi:protein translocase SecG subunit